MSRKDHILIANAINYEFRRVRTIDGEVSIMNVIEQLAQELKNDNHRFDRDKFIEACQNRN